MFQRIHKSLGGAGLVLAVVALIAAIGGTAYAATKLNGTQKKEVEKIAKKSAGKPGAPGATGPQGQPGAAGKEGAKGQTGAPGNDGKSVIVKPAEGTECEERNGAVIEKEGSGNPIEACEGPKGEKGDPWTPESALPPGATETGNWSFNGTTADTKGVIVPISFPLMLEASLTAEHVHVGEASDPTFNAICQGSSTAPTAKPGELCVYLAANSFQGTTFEAIYRQNVLAEGQKGLAGRPGAVLVFAPPTEVAVGSGSFAVTGCKAETAFPCP